MLGAAAAVAAAFASASPAQAFNEQYCGSAGTYKAPGDYCISGAHTWGWHYVSWMGSGCSTVQEYVYRDLTGTGLSNRVSSCPTKYIESYSDLNPYYQAGYSQRGEAINLGPSSGAVYGYAQTCLRGQSC